VTLDKIAVFIKKEAAVKIAVPGDAHIGAVFYHSAGSGGAILRQQWIGYAVGKSAIRLVVDTDKLKGQMGLQQIHHQASTTIPGIGDKLQGLESGCLHVIE